MAQGSTHDRPVLPRLRAELFAAGDDVGVYVGDTLGGAWDWVPGRVERVEKSQKPEFAGDRATRGFYWRVRIAAEVEAGPLVCSTTEPRVILRRDLEALVHAFEDDLHFLAMYCRNYDRDWAPIWAIEAGDPRP